MTAPDVRKPGGNRAIAGQSKDNADIIADELPGSQAEAHERTRLAEKRLATVRAELAFKSVVVHAIDGGFLVGRWGYSRELADIDALENFAENIGARGAQ